MAATLRDADPDDKSEVYRQLGLKLTYHPGHQLVRGAINLKATGHWFFDSLVAAKGRLSRQDIGAPTTRRSV
jgi:hypothetical protein